MTSKSEEHVFGEEFIKTYLASGFGAMSKSEIETLIFYLLRKKDEFSELDNYALAKKLRVSETKVKSLISNAANRYEELNNKAIVGEFVLNLLSGETQLEWEEPIVSLGIENPSKKNEIEHAIKKTGMTPEYGRNREILIFSSEALLTLIVDNIESGDSEFKALVEKNAKKKASHKEILDSSKPARDRASLFIRELADQTTVITLIVSLAKVAFGGG